MKREIKVDRKIVPIHFKKRRPIEIIVGGNYFVSFGQNMAHPCIIEWHNKDRVAIKIISKKSTHILYNDEIGTTPEEAVRNTVTS